VLTHIQIRDFAIIDAAELELHSGLTVLTGETGAGKSILVDALLLAVGGRGGAEVVRHGAERAEVSATFAIAENSGACAWLAEQSIAHDGECVLRRIVGRDGRSRAYINGQTMSVQNVRQLGEHLADIHGQMEHQSIVRTAVQRDLLDEYGGHTALSKDVATAWRKLDELRCQRDDTAAAMRDRLARMELLRFYVTELEALAVTADEVPTLTTERQRLAHRGKLADGARHMAQLLSDEERGEVEQSLNRALAVGRSLVPVDEAVQPIVAALEEALIAAREAVAALDHYQSSLDADPARQEWVEQRLAAIEAVARKHRTDASELPQIQAAFVTELEQLEHSEETLAQLEAQLAAAAQVHRTACARLSKARRTAAVALSEKVTANMQTLGMRGGQFSVELAPLAANAGGMHGAESVEFLMSANPGQPLRSMAKIASGGELSRIGLAVQVAAVETVSRSCLVFDEIDAGVGGGVAQILGGQLRLLGESQQVLCVTHLPQVAGQAHAHIRVNKLTDGKTTRTALHALSVADRTEEIARMLGGVEITDTARRHAAEMLVTREPAKKRGREKKS
jgi:DNA repair protein RecN (Recombination protein N)